MAGAEVFDANEDEANKGDTAPPEPGGTTNGKAAGRILWAGVTLPGAMAAASDDLTWGTPSGFTSATGIPVAGALSVVDGVAEADCDRSESEVLSASGEGDDAAD